MLAGRELLRRKKAQALILYQGDVKLAEVHEGGLALVVISVTEKGACICLHGISLALNDVGMHRGGAL